MRKGYVLTLGLLMILGAAGFWGYRYVYLPQNHSADIGTTRGLSPPQAAGAPSAAGAAKTALTPLQLFEDSLNIANVVVGLLGIWLTVSGMRMQSRAMALMRDKGER